MLVDSALSPSPFCNPNDYPQPDMSDFLNMDLFTSQALPQPTAGPSSTSSGSRASSRSPAPSDTLATPPQPFVVDPDQFTSDFFSFSAAFDNEFSGKVDPLAVPMPIGAAPFDFLAAFGNTSPESASEGSQFAIDPQLVHTPASSTADDKQASPEDRANEGDDEDEHESVASPVSSTTTAAIKAGGKGKSRRGTVASGGIVKKPALSAVVKVRDSEDDKDDIDDWRPSPEEYKKMSSKEKRQLRNKISARNFRVRRKEYITTLEGDIAERDRLIDAIRSELGSTKSENAALREEISALKKALLTAPETPVLPPPGPIPAPVAARAAIPPTPLLAPNTQKDLPASPSVSNKGFWGGGAGMGAFGGVTPVHTTIIPESFARPLANVKPVGRRSPNLQENMNPALNGVQGTFAQNSGAFGLGRTGAFDAFSDNNPFTMKMLDAYRMQLWTRMAQQTRQQQQQQQQPAASQLPPAAPLTGLAANMRPAFFSSSKAPGLSSLISGKHMPASPERLYPTPPASPRMSPKLAPKSEPVTPQHAMLAAMAQQTLFQRLGSAFWDAFSGQPSTSTSTSAKPAFDADKVRRVLEGKAVVRVVDVDEPTPVSRSTPVSVLASPRATPAIVRREADCVATIQSALEESMRALSLGKK